MRAAFCCLFFLFAAIGLGASASASPIAAPPAAAPDTAPLVLVRGGCGRHFHPVVWRDRWGRRHRRCVPNRRWGPPPPPLYPYYYYR